MELNLDDIIRQLSDRFTELNNYSFVEPDPVARNNALAKIHKLLTDLHEEILKWERIRSESGATINIPPVSASDQVALRAALEDLNVAIQQDEVWHRVIGIATTVLEGAAKLRRPAGQPDMEGPVAVAAFSTESSVRINSLLARYASGNRTRLPKADSKRRKSKASKKRIIGN